MYDPDADNMRQMTRQRVIDNAISKADDIVRSSDEDTPETDKKILSSLINKLSGIPVDISPDATYKAVEAVLREISSYHENDGENDKIIHNYLLSQVIRRFFERVEHHYSSKLFTWDFNNPAKMSSYTKQ